jgi:hypothetical protein
MTKNAKKDPKLKTPKQRLLYVDVTGFIVTDRDYLSIKRHV